VTTDLLPSRAITHLTDDVDAEKRQLARDVARDDDGKREPIDPFRYPRYLALGWIRESDYLPYYELTGNGEVIADVYAPDLYASEEW
jgi:hypothetical protein